MSNEINYKYISTGQTIYFTLELYSSGAIWNGLSLVTMVVADWGNYAMPLTETPAGGYRYIASMPSISAGSYIARIYLQSGASPAITDTELALGEINWNGITTVTTPVASVGKSSYLNMINAILKRITQPEIASVAGATGQARIISELINEAQNELWTETSNWHTLYATRAFSTVASTATYALTTDWGRTIDLMDLTNGIILTEDMMRSFDERDPNSDYTGNPTCFAIQGSNYVLYPIPSGVVSMRERYWKIPSRLSADTDISDLPLYCENFLIHWAWMSILQYLQKYEAADRVAMKIYGNPAMKDPGILQKCKSANEKIINQMFRMGGNSSPANGYNGISAPRFPSNYGVNS